MGETACRFTGGPMYWRRRHRGSLITLSDETNEFHVVGLTRPMKYQFRSVKEFEADVAKGRIEVRTGVYKRVEPDRFRWVGWRETS